MSAWTEEEIHTLINLWPASSASPRSAICGKVMRLRSEGVFPHGAHGHFDVNAKTPPQRRAPAAANPEPAEIAATNRRQPRDAGVFDPRARHHPLPLAAWQTARGRGAILRRQRGAGPPLLPASSAHRPRLIGAVLTAMPLSIQHRLAFGACRPHPDVGVITTVVAEVLAANPATNLLEIEQAFRDDVAAAYLVATTEGFEVVLGLMAMLAAVGKAGDPPAENRAALAGKLARV